MHLGILGRRHPARRQLRDSRLALKSVEVDEADDDERPTAE
jgi:hypothetical protein